MGVRMGVIAMAAMLVAVAMAGAVVKPDTRGIAHQRRQASPMDHLHPAKLGLAEREHRQASHAWRCGGFVDTGDFVHDDAREQDGQHEPDHVQTAPNRRWTHRCLHHTVIPTSASTAGMRMTESTKVPFTCRLVMLSRGRSWVRGSMPMRFSCAAR